MRMFFSNIGMRESRLLRRAPIGGEQFREQAPNGEQPPSLEFRDFQGPRGAQQHRLNQMRQQVGGQFAPHRVPGQPPFVPGLRNDPRFTQRVEMRVQKRLSRFGETPNFRERAQERLGHYGYQRARAYAGREPRPEYRSGYRPDIGAYRTSGRVVDTATRQYQTIQKYRRLGPHGMGHRYFEQKAVADSLGIDTRPGLTGTDVAHQSHILRLEQQRNINEARRVNEQINRQRAQTDRILGVLPGREPFATPPRPGTVSGVFSNRNKPPVFTPPKFEKPKATPPKVVPPKPRNDPKIDLQPVPKREEGPESGPTLPTPEDDEIAKQVLSDRALLQEARDNGFEEKIIPGLGLAFVESNETTIPGATAGNVQFFVRKGTHGGPAIYYIDTYEGGKPGGNTSRALGRVFVEFGGNLLTPGIKLFDKLRDDLDAARNEDNPNFAQERQKFRQRAAAVEKTLTTESTAIGMRNEISPNRLLTRTQQGSIVWSIRGTLPDGSNVDLAFEEKGDSLKITAADLTPASGSARKTVSLKGEYFRFVNNDLITVNGGLASAVEELKRESAKPEVKTLAPRREPLPPGIDQTLEGQRMTSTLIDLEVVFSPGSLDTLAPEDPADKATINTMISELSRDGAVVLATGKVDEVTSIFVQLRNFVESRLKDETKSSPEQRAEIRSLFEKFQERARVLREEDRAERARKTRERKDRGIRTTSADLPSPLEREDLLTSLTDPLDARSELVNLVHTHDEKKGTQIASLSSIDRFLERTNDKVGETNTLRVPPSLERVTTADVESMGGKDLTMKCVKAPLGRATIELSFTTKDNETFSAIYHEHKGEYFMTQATLKKDGFEHTIDNDSKILRDSNITTIVPGLRTELLIAKGANARSEREKAAQARIDATLKNLEGRNMSESEEKTPEGMKKALNATLKGLRSLDISDNTAYGQAQVLIKEVNRLIGEIRTQEPAFNIEFDMILMEHCLEHKDEFIVYDEGSRQLKVEKNPLANPSHPNHAEWDKVNNATWLGFDKPHLSGPAGVNVKKDNFAADLSTIVNDSGKGYALIRRPQTPAFKGEKISPFAAEYCFAVPTVNGQREYWYLSYPKTFEDNSYKQIFLTKEEPDGSVKSVASIPYNQLFNENSSGISLNASWQNTVFNACKVATEYRLSEQRDAAKLQSFDLPKNRPIAYLPISQPVSFSRRRDHRFESEWVKDMAKEQRGLGEALHNAGYNLVSTGGKMEPVYVDNKTRPAELIEAYIQEAKKNNIKDVLIHIEAHGGSSIEFDTGQGNVHLSYGQLMDIFKRYPDMRFTVMGVMCHGAWELKNQKQILTDPGGEPGRVTIITETKPEELNSGASPFGRALRKSILSGRKFGEAIRFADEHTKRNIHYNPEVWRSGKTSQEVMHTAKIDEPQNPEQMA